MPKEVEVKRNSVINPQHYNFNTFNMENLMLSKCYKLTKVNRRTWLHMPSETRCSISSDTHQVVEILTQRLILRCIHHYKSDLVNKMDHRRISGNKNSLCLNIKSLGMYLLVFRDLFISQLKPNIEEEW